MTATPQNLPHFPHGEGRALDLAPHVDLVRDGDFHCYSLFVIARIKVSKPNKAIF